MRGAFPVVIKVSSILGTGCHPKCFLSGRCPYGNALGTRKERVGNEGVPVGSFCLPFAGYGGSCTSPSSIHRPLRGAKVGSLTVYGITSLSQISHWDSLHFDVCHCIVFNFLLYNFSGFFSFRLISCRVFLPFTGSHASRRCSFFVSVVIFVSLPSQSPGRVRCLCREIRSHGSEGLLAEGSAGG